MKQSTSIVLIPAYQPSEALIETTSQLLRDGLTVVIVDDGSGRDYLPIFNELDPRIHVIEHTFNRGKGAALKTGYHYIRQRYNTYVIITADADGQHVANDISRMADAYYKHPANLLLGVRTFSGTAVPLRSKFGNTVTKYLCTLLMRQSVGDTQTGLRAFDQSLTDFMLSVPGTKFEYETNVLLTCSRGKVRIAQLPITTIYENSNAQSHFRPLQDSWMIYKEIVKFAASSMLAFGIDYSLFVVLLQLTQSWSGAASLLFANMVARIVSASSNFMINRHFVFSHDGNARQSFLVYALLATGILIANSAVLNYLVNVLHTNAYLAKIMTELSFFVISYAMQKFVIFNQKAVRHI